MELIAKISKGSKMDQIYISKARAGLEAGSYVIIKPILLQEKTEIKTNKSYFYGIKSIEPIKLEIINKIFKIIEKNTTNIQNIIITGSFLEKGFKFNDIDLLVITKNKINESLMGNKIFSTIGIKPHIISVSNSDLQRGLSTDPLYLLMLSKCVSKKRIIFKARREFNRKILDLHLLKSEQLIYNFDILTGEEKYSLIRNLIAIKLFIENKKLKNETVNNEIERIFDIKIIDIKNNLLEKNKFLRIYRLMYKKVQNNVFNLKNDTKQK